MIQLLRTSPGLVVWLAIFAIAAVLCAILWSFMSRAGLSTRPVLWLAGLFLLVGAPQFIAHLFSARANVKNERPRIEALRILAGQHLPDTKAAAARLLFGKDADPALVSDARPAFAGVLANAEQACLAVLPGSVTVLLARFNGHLEAERAWVGYLQHTGLAALGGKGDSQRGYAVTRPAGDRAYVLHMNNMLGVWTGPDDATIRRRMAAGAFRVPRRAPLAEAVDREPDARAVLAADQGSSRFGNKGRGAFGFALPAAGLAGYVLLVGVYFLRGASWASSSPAPEGLAPVGVAELRTRLEALCDVDVPFVIEATADPEELIAIWRYGDARWFGPGRVHGSGRAHRIKLRLDASSHIVYASDYTAEYRWSAGGSGAQLQWKAARGITFFHRERRRTFGVEVDSYGRPKLQSSYSYTFDVLEMKSPLIDVVSRSGWTWRPVVWQGPKWLAWLTG